MSRVALVGIALALALGTAHARPGAGTLSDPIVVDAFPYVARGDSLAGTHAIDRYSCATQNESGGERVYRFALERASRVSAWVEQANGVDVDVHLLADATVSGRQASACVARGDLIAEADLPAGDHFVVVDTFGSNANGGSYVLHLDAIGDAWIARPVAAGVTWRARRFSSLAGGAQVVNELVVEAGGDVRALGASGCQTVGAIGQAAGAVAGINGGYFDVTTCAPVSLLKTAGVLEATNPSTTARGAFGISTAKQPLVDRIGGGADWPAAHHAHGGGPLLAVGGAAKNGGAAWLEEGYMSASFLGVNPRSFAGFDAMGRAHLGAVDGRRVMTTARGMTMDDLAAFVVSGEIGCGDAVNLDGGGSTTLWIKGALPNGVVNYPSDAGATETAAHGGSRGVSGGLFVFAAAYNHPPRFQTRAPSTAAEFPYDADAIDLDVDDVVGYRLDEAPAGAMVDGDGVVTFLGTQGSFKLVAFDGRGGEAAQAWTIGAAAGGGDDGGAAVGDLAAGDPGDGGGADGGDGGLAPDAPDLASATGKTGGCATASAGAAATAGGGMVALTMIAFATIWLARRRQ